MPTIMKSGSDDKPHNYFQNVRQEMLDYVPKSTKRVLEVGCGEGIFAAAIKHSRNAECWGIEIESVAASKAKQTLDKVLVGDIVDLLPKLPNDYFDLIVFNDVLEHMVDPFFVLASIQSKLTPKGYVLSSIPNIRYFHTLYALVMGGEWEYQESGILDRTHLRFFTTKSIQNMYTRLGYKIIKHVGINPIPTVPKQLKLANLFGRDRFDDTQYEQFATLAQVTSAGRKIHAQPTT